MDTVSMGTALFFENLLTGFTGSMGLTGLAQNWSAWPNIRPDAATSLFAAASCHRPFKPAHALRATTGL
jgi:hypothetical protein